METYGCCGSFHFRQINLSVIRQYVDYLVSEQNVKNVFGKWFFVFVFFYRNCITPLLPGWESYDFLPDKSCRGRDCGCGIILDIYVHEQRECK